MKITRIRRTEDGVDRYNKPKYIDATSELEVIAFAPTVEGETVATEETRLGFGGTLYLHPDSDVTESDSFTIYGERYEADGPKAPWADPFSNWYPGDVLIVKRTEYIDA